MSHPVVFLGALCFAFFAGLVEGLPLKDLMILGTITFSAGGLWAKVNRIEKKVDKMPEDFVSRRECKLISHKLDE